MRFRLMTIAFIATGFLTGCRKAEWTIDVENKSKESCGIRVDFDYSVPTGKGTSDASMKQLDSGKTIRLISGDRESTIRSVKVMRGDKETEFQPAAKINPGDQLRIIVPQEGPPELKR